MIGEDGFGAYETENHRKVMIKHYGGVTIGDDVYIGSHVDTITFFLFDVLIIPVLLLSQAYSLILSVSSRYSPLISWLELQLLLRLPRLR